MSPGLLPALLPLVSRLRRLFDLDAAPDCIAAVLGSLAAENPGIRVPGAFDGFEVAMRAVLGQQINVPAATTIAARIVAGAVRGTRADSGRGTKIYSSNGASDCRGVINELRKVGLTEARATTLHGLASAVAQGRIHFLNVVPWEDAMKELTAIPGIGPWTASYIAMRVLGWPDAFPHQDLGLQRALSVKKAEVLALSEKWRPWGAYAAMQLCYSLEKQHELSNDLPESSR